MSVVERTAEIIERFATVDLRSLGARSRLAHALAAADPPLLVTDEGVTLIAAERRRQVEIEGWTPEHDAEHVDGELSGAAACYARLASRQEGSGYYHAEATAPPGQEWRWSSEWWKPSDDPVRNLVKAGALIAAEIDRLLASRGET